MTTTISNTLNLQRSVQTVLRPSAISSIARPMAARPSYSVLCRAEHGKHEDLDSDSYQRIEAPVRGGEQAPGSIPDGGPPIRERESELDREIVASAGNRERDILNSEVSLADSFRFKGAAPEIINSRLAMLGFIAAVGAELATGRKVSQQVAIAPGPIAGVFLLFTVASLIPILKGVPRKGGKDWGGLPQFTPDAELINGRVAMLGFAGLVFTEWAIGHAVF